MSSFEAGTPRPLPRIEILQEGRGMVRPQQPRPQRPQMPSEGGAALSAAAERLTAMAEVAGTSVAASSLDDSVPTASASEAGSVASRVVPLGWPAGHPPPPGHVSSK